MKSLLVNRKYWILTLLIALFTSNISAQDIPKRPNPPRLVNDFGDMLSTSEESHLERSLVEFNNQTSTQITIVTVKSLNGYDKSDFAYRIGEEWGVGQKGKNNGILILVKPKTASSRGEAFIATGYGVEGAIPDATAYAIVNNEMIPHFKRGEIYEGFVSTIYTIMELTRGEYTADAYMKRGGRGKQPAAGGGIIFLIIMFVVLRSIFSRRRHHTFGGSALPWFFLGSMMGGSRGSSFSDFSGGGGSFGGGSFGGFGGGSFGGGGAGGSW